MTWFLLAKIIIYYLHIVCTNSVHCLQLRFHYFLKVFPSSQQDAKSLTILMFVGFFPSYINNLKRTDSSSVLTWLKSIWSNSLNTFVLGLLLSVLQMTWGVWWSVAFFGQIYVFRGDWVSLSPLATICAISHLTASPLPWYVHSLIWLHHLSAALIEGYWMQKKEREGHWLKSINIQFAHILLNSFTIIMLVQMHNPKLKNVRKVHILVI